MNKIMKTLIIFISLTMILTIFASHIFAANFDTSQYEPNSQTEMTGDDAAQMKIIGNTIIGLIRTIGSLASVAVLIALGIKYMAGSIEEKAQYKQSLVPYIIGAALTFGIINILGLIIDLAGLFK